MSEATFKTVTNKSLTFPVKPPKEQLRLEFTKRSDLSPQRVLSGAQPPAAFVQSLTATFLPVIPLCIRGQIPAE